MALRSRPRYLTLIEPAKAECTISRRVHESACGFQASSVDASVERVGVEARRSANAMLRFSVDGNQHSCRARAA